MLALGSAKFWRTGNTMLLSQPSLVAVLELAEAGMLGFRTSFRRRRVGTSAAKVVPRLLTNVKRKSRKNGRRMKTNAELRLVGVDKRPRTGAEVSPSLERSWFEFDRGVVLRQLDDLNAAIGSNANELKMVAAEGVFDPALSDGLLRTSRALRVIGNSIIALRKQVMRAAEFPAGPSKK